MTSPSSRRAPVSPQLVVFAVLLAGFGWVFAFPLSLTRPPAGFPLAAYTVGLLVFGVALLLVVRSAVYPPRRPRTTLVRVGLLLLATLAVWAPTYAWAHPGHEPWAWVAGFAVGAATLADPRAGTAAALVLAGAAAGGAVVFGGSVLANVAIALGCALGLWLVQLALVWLLGLVRAAEAGRETAAALAVAQERLRVSRELHDVLGHRLGIIALKAELAEGLAARDPDRAARENAQIRTIASATLAEARRAVHGDTAGDLGAQLSAAALVLRSAGIGPTIDVDLDRLSPAASRLLAAVVREAVTNLLRHARARAVWIAYDGPSATLMVTNDGVRPLAGAVGSGTGLTALTERCAAAGARLTHGPTGDGRFEVRVELSPQHVGRR